VNRRAAAFQKNPAGGTEKSVSGELEGGTPRLAEPRDPSFRDRRRASIAGPTDPDRPPGSV
jgi:hypothetical protein